MELHFLSLGKTFTATSDAESGKSGDKMTATEINANIHKAQCQQMRNDPYPAC